MVDLRTLGILLDRLQIGSESLLATRPLVPVARTTPSPRVARDASPSEPPVVARDASPSEPPVAAPRDRPMGPDAFGRRVPDALVEAHGAAIPSLRPGLGAVASNTAPVIADFRAGTSSASLELSATAQWLQRSLLPDPAHPPVASIRALAPLLRAAPDDVHVLAQALRESVVRSGLFYEAHLAEWTVQQFPEADLRREPQAGWSHAATTHEELPVVRDTAEGSAPAAATGASDPHGQVSIDLLRAQLQALELRQFSWQGELWPRQMASMIIAEDDAPPTGGRRPAWRAHLSLRLPLLGPIDVDLCLDGDTLNVAVAASAQQSVQHLREARVELASALERLAHCVPSVSIRQS